MLQRLLTGLLPPIRRQLLLQGKPDTLTQVISDAVNIEFALNFAREADSNSQEVHAVHHKPSTQEPSGSSKLQESLNQIVKRLKALEASHRQSSLPLAEYPDRSHLTVDNASKGDSVNTVNQPAGSVANLVTSDDTAL